MEMIRDVSRRQTPGKVRKSPIAGRRSPLAGVLERDPGLEAFLRELDIVLFFPFLDLPRKAIGMPPETLLPDLDEAAIERLRAGRAYLVLDHSNEGPPHQPAFSELLHAWCHLHGVAASSVLYVSMNAVYAERYTEWCDTGGLTDRYGHLLFNTYLEEVAAVS